MSLQGPRVSDPEVQRALDFVYQQFPIATAPASVGGMAAGSFSAYRAAAASLGTGASVPFDTEEWDDSNWHLGGIYQPRVAGRYRFNWCVGSAGLTIDNFIAGHLFKNGAAHKDGPFAVNRGNAAALSVNSVSALANGTTDTFEIRVVHNQGGALALLVGQALAYFQGELVGKS